MILMQESMAELALRPTGRKGYIEVILQSITRDHMAEVYEKGLVILPKKVRDAYKLYPGTKVTFSMEKEGVLVKRQNDWLSEFRALRAELATHSSKDMKKMMAESEKKMHEEWSRVP
jgi:bifunctional DNA-binding transcriptional regulator/antitoxin component of YhaV-PrlF toxin-antitoxin module